MIDKDNMINTFKKSYHIAHNKNYFCCLGSAVNLYDLKSGILVSTFKNIKQPGCAKFTSDGNLIVKNTKGKYYIYDLTSMTLTKVIPQPKKVLSSTTDFQVTPDDKYIIDFSYVFPKYELMVIEIETGAYTFFNLENCRGGSVFKTENESKYYIIAHCAETLHSSDVSMLCFYELSYSLSKFQLEKLFVEKNRRISCADYALNKFVMADYGKKIFVLDIQNKTKEIFEREQDEDGDLYNHGVLYNLKLSQDGRFIALAESNYISIYDSTKGKRIKTYEVDYGCFVDFFDNDTKLLIGTWQKGFCISL